MNAMIETLKASSALCFLVAVALTTMAVWAKFHRVARLIVNVPTVGAIFHAAWIADVILRKRFNELSQQQILLAEIAGYLWVGVAIIASTFAWWYTTEYGNADDQGESSTCRAFLGDNHTINRATSGIKKSGIFGARR